MKRLLALLAVCGLAACGTETGSDDEACGEAEAVTRQISEYRGLSELTPEQAETARQWEFRLAEAAVLATDHDLSDDIRDLADAAGNVAEDMSDENAMATFNAIYDSVEKRCN